MNEVNARNAAALHQAVRTLQETVCEQQVQLNAQAEALSGMSQRIAALERMVVVEKARSAGHGPTVRE